MTKQITKVRRGGAALVALGVVWGAMAVSAGAQATRSVNEGVYTAAQAARGKAAFEKTCTACHELERFVGPEFVKTWSGQPLLGLWETVNTMPEDNPGSLEPQAYADIMAYMLTANEYPAGPAELAPTVEAMRAVSMEARK